MTSTLNRASWLVLIAVPLLLAACGTSSAPASSNTGNTQSAALKYAQCMRQAGINIPDPNANGGFSGSASGGGPGAPAFDPNSPQFQTADKSCRKSAGLSNAQNSNNGGTPPIVQQAMRYAQCMRQHGVANYPDPVVNNGTVTLGPGPGSNIDQSTPSYQSAATACKSLAPNGTQP